MKKSMNIDNAIDEVSTLRTFLHQELEELDEGTSDYFILHDICMGLTLALGSLIHTRANGFSGETDGQRASFFRKRG